MSFIPALTSHVSRRASRQQRQHLHLHCESCYSVRCRARVEPAVSCPLAACRLLCGASFHLCKEEEHLLLCPSVRVPCLNAQYGCPATMPRAGRASHLRLCPASVVSCSMEWNRWPADDCHAHTQPELYERLLAEEEEEEEGGGGEGHCSLDLALALGDQQRLFHSLKMKKLFPELTQGEEVEVEGKKERKKEKSEGDKMEEEASGRSHTWEPMSCFGIRPPVDEDSEAAEELGLESGVEPGQGPGEEPELSQEEREALARSSAVDPDLLESYSAWERIFSMEMGGCRAAGHKGGHNTAGKGINLIPLAEEEDADAGPVATATDSRTGLMRRAKDTRVSALPISQGKRFVYGHIEPMKIITVRTFKVPTSFSARQGRIRNPGFYKRESRAVDTSDLGVALEDMPVWEEVQASLLCSLEKEQRGHLVAEASSIDALLQNEGTQTYNFLSAPFRHSTSLADLTARRPRALYLQLQVEGVTSRHHKASSTFTILCGHSFQRREYGMHFRNVHSDIQMCVNGWFEQRCPLAYLGCTYTQRRFQPSTHKATVTYDQKLGSFTLRPDIPTPPSEGSLLPGTTAATTSDQRRRGVKGGRGEDSLSGLPYEVLCHMASFLDSLSLSQLALVSRLMRDVCSSQLLDRGMVTLHWERSSSSHHGGAKWRARQKVWQFSTMFSPVDKWCLQDVPPMSEHLKVCPYYQKESRTDRVRLPRARDDVCTSTPSKGPSLLGLFKNKTIIM